MRDESVLAEGLGYLEAPRWHNGELWFSDFYSRWISTVNESGKVTRRVYVAGQPSGLGFLADGALLLVSSHMAHIVRWIEAEQTVVADVGAVYRGALNDMVVDGLGRAYVSTLPPPIVGQKSAHAGSTPSAPIFLVEPSGAVTAVAEELQIPNGMAITPDGNTLVVAETLGNRLLAYDIQADGTLRGLRVFADMDDRKPDGISLDADGNVWVGCFNTSEFVLVAEGGAVIRTIPTPGRWAVACALGGSSGTTLFGLTTRVTMADYREGRGEGAIMAYRVDTPAASSPQAPTLSTKRVGEGAT